MWGPRVSLSFVDGDRRFLMSTCTRFVEGTRRKKTGRKIRNHRERDDTYRRLLKIAGVTGGHRRWEWRSISMLRGQKKRQGSLFVGRRSRYKSVFLKTLTVIETRTFVVRTPFPFFLPDLSFSLNLHFVRVTSTVSRVSHKISTLLESFRFRACSSGSEIYLSSSVTYIQWGLPLYWNPNC